MTDSGRPAPETFNGGALPRNHLDQDSLEAVRREFVRVKYYKELLVATKTLAGQLIEVAEETQGAASLLAANPALGYTREAIAQDKGFAQYVLWASLLQAWGRFDADDGLVSINDFRIRFDASRTSMGSLLTPYWGALLASVCAKAGQTQEALVLIDEALAEVARRGECFWQAELHRIRGDLMFQVSGADNLQAGACYQQALAVARA